MLTAVYPGTFDPFTLGHQDVARRGAEIFDGLIVAVGSNPAKAPLFSVEERVDMVRSELADIGNIQVHAFDGLLVDYVRRIGSRVVLRGLRTLSDFEYEFQMALTNRTLAKDVETLFLMPSIQYTALNAQLIREIAAMGGPLGEFLGPAVEERLRARLKDT